MITNRYQSTTVTRPTMTSRNLSTNQQPDRIILGSDGHAYLKGTGTTMTIVDGARKKLNGNLPAGPSHQWITSAGQVVQPVSQVSTSVGQPQRTLSVWRRQDGRESRVSTNSGQRSGYGTLQHQPNKDSSNGQSSSDVRKTQSYPVQGSGTIIQSRPETRQSQSYSVTHGYDTTSRGRTMTRIPEQNVSTLNTRDADGGDKRFAQNSSSNSGAVRIRLPVISFNGVLNSNTLSRRLSSSVSALNQVVDDQSMPHSYHSQMDLNSSAAGPERRWHRNDYQSERNAEQNSGKTGGRLMTPVPIRFESFRVDFKDSTTSRNIGSQSDINNNEEFTKSRPLKQSPDGVDVSSPVLIGSPQSHDAVDSAYSSSASSSLPSSDGSKSSGRPVGGSILKRTDDSSDGGGVTSPAVGGARSTSSLSTLTGGGRKKRGSRRVLFKNNVAVYRFETDGESGCSSSECERLNSEPRDRSRFLSRRQPTNHMFPSDLKAKSLSCDDLTAAHQSEEVPYRRGVASLPRRWGMTNYSAGSAMEGGVEVGRSRRVNSVDDLLVIGDSSSDSKIGSVENTENNKTHSFTRNRVNDTGSGSAIRSAKSGVGNAVLNLANDTAQYRAASQSGGCSPVISQTGQKQNIGVSKKGETSILSGSLPNYTVTETVPSSLSPSIQSNIINQPNLAPVAAFTSQPHRFTSTQKQSAAEQQMIVERDTIPQNTSRLHELSCGTATPETISVHSLSPAADVVKQAPQRKIVTSSSKSPTLSPVTSSQMPAVTSSTASSISSSATGPTFNGLGETKLGERSVHRPVSEQRSVSSMSCVEATSSSVLTPTHVIHFDPATQSRTLRTTFDLSELRLRPTDIRVKSNKSGTVIHVIIQDRMSSSFSDGEEATKGQGEIDKRVVLPVAVDPYKITAQLERPNRLVVQAPLVN